MTNMEIDKIIDKSRYNIAWDEFRMARNALDFASKATPEQALDIIENVEEFLRKVKIKLNNAHIYDSTRTN